MQKINNKSSKQPKMNKAASISQTTTTHYKSERSFNSLQEEQVNPDLKNTQYLFSYKTDDEDILELFQETAGNIGFQMVERQQTYGLAIKQYKSKMIDLFGCFPFMNKTSSTAVKLSLSKSVNHGSIQVKICRIKGLVGSITQIKQFLALFKQKIRSYQYEANYLVFQEAKQEVSDRNQYSDPYNIQISSFYTIEKMLNQQQNDIGKYAQKMINDYVSSFKNVQESITLLPLPMNDATKIVNELMFIFNENISKPQTIGSLKKKKSSNKQGEKNKITKNELQPAAMLFLHPSIFPFTRISIQKYIFIKLQDTLYSIYKFKNIDSNKIFLAKRTKIFKKYTLKQIFQQTSLTEKYWSIEREDLQKINSSMQRQEARKIIKFSKVCEELQKISIASNPRQKIKYTEIMYTSLKTFFYDFSKRKYQLSSMEDIIPVLIIVVLLCNVAEMRTQFDIMNDFVLTDPYQMQSEKRLLINLSESYNFIIRDWKI